MSKLKISKSSAITRLFEKDQIHINKVVTDLGKTDTRFKDKSGAIRHYVRIGIAAEKRVAAANSLDDKIIKASQREVVSETLLPIKNSIDLLIQEMQNFGREQSSFFDESFKQTNILIRRVESIDEHLITHTHSLLNEITKDKNLSKETFRNIIIIRSILYVFLLAYKTGKLDPNENINWEAVVNFAHSEAHKLATEELKTLQNDVFETTVVKSLAAQVFKFIRTNNLSPK